MSPEEARLKLIEALKVVRIEFDRSGDDWQWRLLRTFRKYCQEIGVETHLQVPLQDMLQDVANEILKGRDPGGDGRKTNYKDAVVLSTAAAYVTVLVERGQYENASLATAAVARKTGLDKTKINSFRKNLPKKSADIRKGYEETVADFRTWPSFETLGDLKAFSKNPPISRT